MDEIKDVCSLTWNPSMLLSLPPIEDLMYGFEVLGWMHCDFRASICEHAWNQCGELKKGRGGRGWDGRRTSLMAEGEAEGLKAKKTVWMIVVMVQDRRRFSVGERFVVRKMDDLGVFTRMSEC